MPDSLTPERRSANMRRIRSRGTKPELLVRQTAHRLGFRFRLYRKDLPGTPDLVFPRYRTVLFVHGCFWHQHGGCREGRMPGSNQAYWQPKLAKNVLHDDQNRQALIALGWRVATIWECEVRAEGLGERIRELIAG